MANQNRPDAQPISGSGKGNLKKKEEDFSRRSECVRGSINGTTFSIGGNATTYKKHSTVAAALHFVVECHSLNAALAGILHILGIFRYYLSKHVCKLVLCSLPY